jgi:hypothetical protein
MKLPEIRKQILSLKKKRETAELKLIRTRSKLIAGSLYKKFTACRKGNCKCTKGQLHGPFLYLSQKTNGKLKQRYAGKDTDKPMVKKVKDYMSFQETLADIRKINKEMDSLFNLYREILTVSND